MNILHLLSCVCIYCWIGQSVKSVLSLCVSLSLDCLIITQHAAGITNKVCSTTQKLPVRACAVMAMPAFVFEQELQQRALASRLLSYKL